MLTGSFGVDEALALGRDLELELEVRPVADSGLLLYAGVRKSQQLSVYLDQGKVSTTCLRYICTSGVIYFCLSGCRCVELNLIWCSLCRWLC